MTKSKKCEQIIKQVAEAFGDTPRPKNDNFGYDWYDSADDNMATKFSKYKRWSEIPFELLYKYRDDLIFLTDEGFRYMLPAFMTFIVIKREEADTLIDNLIRYLTHPKFLYPNSYTSQDQKKFEKRVYSFSKEEQNAIFAFLECYGDLFSLDLKEVSYQQDWYESALIYWYLLVNGDLPKPNKNFIVRGESS